MDARFKIGDSVFKGRYERVETFVVCPDCLGSKTVRVILGDGTELTIECGGCDPGGFMPPTGRIKQHNYETQAASYIVTGVKVTREEVEYELNNWGQGSYYTAKEGDLFITKEDAIAEAEKKRLEYEADENKRLMSKTKDAKSWAWNATYHRRQIADHERQLEYHRKKVQVCAAKAKADK